MWIPLLSVGVLAVLIRAVFTIRRLWRSVPRCNADFGAIPATASPTIFPSGDDNPASAFYARTRSARAFGVALRAFDAVSPSLGTRIALRMFFTPLPWKLAARNQVPAPWMQTNWRFEGVSLAVYRRGDVEPGRSGVLLVHGWAGSSQQMRVLGDALAEAGFDPVLLDFPGHGHSGGWRSTLPQFTRAIFAATARLGPWLAVVAHSAGALAALHAVARGLPARRLALLAPADPPAMFLRWFAANFGLADTTASRMRDHIERREAVELSEFEPEWLARRVAQPCLVVHDEADRVASFASGQRLARALTRARMHPTQGLGHRRMLAAASVAEAVIDHLRA